MTYQLYVVQGVVSNNIARHNDDGSISYVPNNMSNPDWMAYQLWLAQGHTPDPE